MEIDVNVARTTVGIPALRFDSTPRRAGRLPRRVVVTGIGVIAPSGVGLDSLWAMLVEGRSAVRPVEGFDVSEYPVRIAAQLRDFDALDHMPRRISRGLDRLAQFAVAATRLAVEDARVPEGMLATPRTGLFLGTAAGPVQTWEDQVIAFKLQGIGRVRPTFPMAGSPNCAVAQCANLLGVRGPISTVSSDCAAGMDAVVTAYRQIAMGVVDVAVAGGADSPVTPLLFAGFARSGMLAAGDGDPSLACRPFDRQRAGFVLGEGAVMFVLEDAEGAVRRGARLFGEILGAATMRDRPTYLGETNVQGEGYLGAAIQALRDAGLGVEGIDHVNAHAPGVKTTDLAEARALGTLLGRSCKAIPVTSIKGSVGHALAAAGGMQIATALKTFQEGVIPPTLNCVEPDEDCTFDVVRGVPRRAVVRRALVNSHGFGGNTTSIVLASPGSMLS